MIVVIDASAAVKLVLDEDHSNAARALWYEPLDFFAPTLIVAEVAAAVTAAERQGRVDADACAHAHELWKRLAQALDLRVVDAQLCESARRIAAHRPVRGMDAIYLAAAYEIAADGDPPILFSFDARQRNAAADLSLMPASVGRGTS